MDVEYTLLTQELYNISVLNPTSVKLDNPILLDKIRNSIALKRKIYAQLKSIILPVKFTVPESNTLMIEVHGWTFEEKTYKNNEARHILGYIGLNKIPDFNILNVQDISESVNFNCENGAGTSNVIRVREISDLTDFSIEIKDVLTDTPIHFLTTIHPIFALYFYFE